MTEEFLLRPLTQEQIDDWRQSIKYRVEVHNGQPVKVLGLFRDREAAEQAMSNYESSEDYDYWHETIWLVEVSPDGTEKDLYGYT